MLTRRQIRVKVMQAIYAYYNGNHQSLRDGTKSIRQSCHDMVDLYYTLLALLKGLWDFANEQHNLQSKNRRSDNALNENYSVFIALNPFQLIAKHPFLGKKIEQNKINIWELEFDYVRSLFEKIVVNEAYLTYKSIAEPTFKHQSKLILQLFKEVIAPDDRLYRYIEDLNIQWIDDLPVVNTYLLKQLRKLRTEDMSSLNFPDLSVKTEDIDFGLSLYEKVIANQEFLEKEFEGKTPNWDPDRIAMMDSMLIKIAIAELIYFPEIPPKVSINEYLEIAKEYSTPKSNQFINGVLDNLVKEYVLSNRLDKKGRGLLQ